MPSLALFGPKTIRVAAIEIRAVNDDQFNALVDTYTKYAGEGHAPIAIKDGYSFESGDKEVRIVKPSHLDKQNLAVVYWEVKGQDSSDIENTYEKWLRKYDYQSVEAPSQDGTLVDNANQPTYSTLLKDEHGYQIGLVVNPPYPRDDKSDYLPWSSFFGEPISWILTILLTLGGVGLGIRRGMRLGIKKGIQQATNSGG